MYFHRMQKNNIKKYNKKVGKLKNFSKRNLYKKIYPSLLRQSIPQDYLTTEGITKETVLSDLYRLIDCNNNISYLKIKKLIKTFSDDILIDSKVVKENSIFHTNHCNIFSLCSVCAEKVSRRRREKHRDGIQYLVDNSKYVYMVTFTTLDAKTFNQSYYNLTEAIRKYVLMGQKREYGKGGGEFAKIKGMAISKEIKLGKYSKDWHVHGHGIVFTDDEIDYSIYNQEKRKEIQKRASKKGRKATKEELRAAVINWGKIDTNEIDENTGEIKQKKIPVSKASAEWIKATGGTSANIKFSPIKHPDAKRVNSKFRNIPIDKSCHEIIKYTSKISDFNADQIIEILTNRKEKRFFTTYGDLYDYWDKSNRTRVHIEETILKLLDLKGYMWSNKNNKLIPMNRPEREHMRQRYKNRDNLKRVQSEIMQCYYIKEDMIKKIMSEYMDVLKREKEKPVRERVRPKVAQMRKLNTIQNINDLNGAYVLHKRDIFKKYMNIPRIDKKNIKFTGIQNAFFIKAENLTTKQ